MRNISSAQIVKEMKAGWNLGNTLDAPTETGWGNPQTTQAMMTAVKAAGFNTVRIPVTWDTHIGAAPNYAVNAAWMDRVQQVADYVISTGMYAIINTHHDAWVSLMPTADQAAVSDKLTKLWTQIANRFKNYDDHLIFETLNEPRTTDATEWTGGTPAARAILNTYNLAAVNAIRATGGNNALRQIMIPAHGACFWAPCLSDLSIPNNDARIIISVHAYLPDDLSLGTGTAWGTAADKAALSAAIDGIYALVQQKGRAAVLGEWGTYHKNNTAARVAHAGAYAQAATAHGICPIWWDNGVQTVNDLGFALLNRSTNPSTWVYPEIMNALVAGANAGSASAP